MARAKAHLASGEERGAKSLSLFRGLGRLRSATSADPSRSLSGHGHVPASTHAIIPRRTWISVSTSRVIVLSLLMLASGERWGALGNVPEFGNRPELQTTVVTFNEVAPIISKHCVSCHRPGQMAPMSLTTYQEVRPWARAIRMQVVAGDMPPWLPEAGYGEFSNQRRLSNDQIDLIQQWVADGAIEGDSRLLPVAPEWPDEWQLGRPDLVVEMPRPYTLEADGPAVFRNFVIPLPLASMRYVRGVEFRPSNPRVVHHAVIRVDRTRTARGLDEKDREPGYDGMLVDAAHSPSGVFLGWTPGKTPLREAASTAWRLEPGTDVVINAHMLPTGEPEMVQFQIGFFFTDRPPTREPFMIRLGSEMIDIPAGQKDYPVSDTYVLPVDVEVRSVYPHAHYLAKDVKGFARLPDGTMRWLIWIKDWDFNWQDAYVYATPILLPRGTTISMQYTYDNSVANVRNPHYPPRRVVYGPHSSDEMADLWIQVLPRNPADVAVLERDYLQRDRDLVIADTEQLVQANPSDAEQHNFLAARYLEAGRTGDAIVHLEDALRLKPDYAEAHSNLGSALQSQGKLTDAIGHFRQAISINPRLAEAHNNLGVALGSQGELDEAVSHFRQAVEINPEYGEVRANLGVALGSQGRVDEAIVHLRRALEINPRDRDAQKALDVFEKLRGRQHP